MCQRGYRSINLSADLHIFAFYESVRSIRSPRDVSWSIVDYTPGSGLSPSSVNSIHCPAYVECYFACAFYHLFKEIRSSTPFYVLEYIYIYILYYIMLSSGLYEELCTVSYNILHIELTIYRMFNTISLMMRRYQCS